MSQAKSSPPSSQFTRATLSNRRRSESLTAETGSASSGNDCETTAAIISNETAGSFRMVSLLWMSGIALLMVPMATLFDVPIARWFLHKPLPEFVGQILNFSVYYSQGSGVFLVLTLVILFMPKRRWCVPRLATLAMGAGAVATLAKMFVLRPRPSSLYLEAASYDYAWIWSFDWSLSQVATWDAATRAFPSASLATATALTVGLCAVQPKGRWLFVLLCVGTMLQRAFCGAHFISDLFGSASVGLAWAYVCYHPSLMGSVFEKMEPERRQKRQRWPTESAASRQENQEAIVEPASDQENDRIAA